MNGPSSSSSSHNQQHRHRHHHQSLPKIRKAKSQSFRTRRSPSERRSPNAPTLTLNTNAANGEKKRSPLTPKSPVLPQPESKSPGSSSQKTPTSLSRQGTLRASSRRKNSGQLTISLSAQNQGRRSPVGLNDRSPQGRRSPLFPSSDLRSPNGQHSPTARSPTGDSQRRSPTFSIQIHTQERRSPLGATAPTDFSCQAGPSGTRRSPTSTVHVQDMATEPEEAGFIGLKRPSINLFTPIYFASEKRSPMGPIPPIMISNPAETYKSAEREREAAEAAARELEKEAAQAQPPPEKKSVMREILAFVRKPSKHISTRTNRFANAFTRAESGSSSGPLIRQSTFSASPAASSTAAKSAVQKQMSEVGFEPKMSLKFAHYTKMSLKLRRSARREEEEKQQQQQLQQKASAVSSAAGSKRASADSNAGIQDQVGGSGAEEDLPFELANVHFEKVGESYIKHERLRELVEPEPEPEAEPEGESVDKEPEQTDAAMAQFVEEVTNSLKVVALNGEGGVPAVHHFTRRSESREPIEPRISEERESDSNDLIIPEELRAELVEILKAYAPEPVYVNLQALRRETEEAEAVARAVAEAAAAVAAAAALPPPPEKLPLQCPAIEFEPPSRRSSFDPPRSPFLEQLRSPGGDTDTDLINLQRLDSGGDSFEMVDGDRKSSRAESSFDCPYSSRDTSFDVSISRYQSTSYEDQTSSFEIVDTDDRRRHIDIRKSSIELVDADTFQRSGSSCGRKSSLETHFDYTPSETSGVTPARSPNFPMTKKQKAEHFRQLHISPFSAFSRARSPLSQQTSSNYSSRDSYDSSSSYPHGHEPQRSPYADPSKKHFPLTIKQREEEVKTFLCTDLRCASIFEPRPSSVLTQQLSTGSMSTPSASGYSASRVPGTIGSSAVAVPSGSVGVGVGIAVGVGVPHNNASLGSCGFSSGSEFEPPSPRRAASASPKHTFTFRIVMKKVDSSPEALCPERHRSRIIDRYRRRDSRRKRIHDAGKSF